MKKRARYLAVILMTVLASIGLSGHAFTLGELRGNAVIGRSLDVSVPVQMGEGEEVSPSCLGAEVYHADVQQTAPVVTVSSVASTSQRYVLVRVRSQALVDEPVVTLVLRSTCGSVTARRYLMLSDFPANSQVGDNLAPALVDAPAIAATSALHSKLVTPPMAAASAPVVKPIAPKRTISPKKTSTLVQAAQKPKPPAATSKPVLKLDSPMVVPEPASSASLAADLAIAAERAQQVKQLELLQEDVKALKALSLKNESTVVDLRRRLQQEQSGGIALIWFYLLLAVLLCCLVAIAWLLWRQQRAKEREQAWWQSQNNAGTVSAPEPTTSPSPPVDSFSVPSFFSDVDIQVSPGTTPVKQAPDTNAVAVKGAPSQLSEELDLDIDLSCLTPSPEQAAPSTPSKPQATHDALEVSRLNMEQILDVRQQAEFFISLGQTDRALDILQKQIAEASHPNPVVYLDLLTLYHSLSMKSNFRECRTAFHQHFNGLVPDFPAFHAVGNDLLAYPETLSSLVAVWPGPESLRFLEQCIFRNILSPVSESFDMAAFDDLLMLHSMAEMVAANGALNPGKPSIALKPLAGDPQSKNGQGQLMELDLSKFGTNAFQVTAIDPEKLSVVTPNVSAHSDLIPLMELPGLVSKKPT